MPRIYLSPPHLTGEEAVLAKDAFDTNWVAPLGPHVDAFESEVAGYVGVAHAAALSSGTAALHLSLLLAGVTRDDEVLCASLTFAGSANPIAYVGARPVFIDSERTSWNLDPNLLEDELREADARGKRPKALIAVDIYGQCADYEAIEALCARYELTLIEDAAEALGASALDKKAGAFGRLSILSFNGNKIITTSGGGMLLSNEASLVERARFLSTQARDPAPHYEHSTIGYNYRMSNVLAAVGRAQLRALDARVDARRRVYARYAALLGDLPGLEFMPQAPWGRATRWLTCVTIDEARFGASREDVRSALVAADIEARPVWKPMHLQPVFASARVRASGVAEDLFARGLCLPSGSSLRDEEIEEIAAIVRSVARPA